MTPPATFANSEQHTPTDREEQTMECNKTVRRLLEILQAPKASNYAVFISPHYFYPTDSNWLFNGPLESDEFRSNAFARTGALT